MAQKQIKPSISIQDIERFAILLAQLTQLLGTFRKKTGFTERPSKDADKQLSSNSRLIS
jgi:hypothetical protein